MDFSFPFQMFPSQAISLGQIPQGITAQVGPSTLPTANVIPNHTSPPQMFHQQQQQPQQGALPTYYDVAQQQQQHAINRSVQHLVLSFFSITAAFHICLIARLGHADISVFYHWFFEGGWSPSCIGHIGAKLISLSRKLDTVEISTSDYFAPVLVILSSVVTWDRF